MATRSRALPVWMKKKKETEEERRKHVKRKPERAAFYCMNEEELTRAAAAWLDPRHVTLLTDPQVEEKPGYTTVSTKRRKSDSSKMIARLATEEEKEEEEEEEEEKKEEGSLDYGDSREESTYVSESDSDLTEAQTVLYTEIPQYQGSEGQRSEPDQDHSSRLQVEDRQEEEEEDDALGLVREIFFYLKQALLRRWH